mmetsp:Transcript_29130/g.62168  ORF Transcript_29130/g.62168 Transcript_29130/m.62168 type:complete len:233 (+) Transcript_29130:1269-1967(+)
MQPHLHLKRSCSLRLHHFLVLRPDKRNVIFGHKPGSQHIVEMHILEAHLLADLVVVGNVNPHWHPRIGEGNHVQGRKIRPCETGLLELLGPRQLGQQRLRPAHQFIEFLALLPVHRGHQPLKLGPLAEAVAVVLDEPDVGLHCWTHVLNPFSLGLLVGLQLTCLEVLNVGLEHLSLGIISHKLQGLLQVVHHRAEQLPVVPVHHADLPPLELPLVLLAGRLVARDVGGEEDI